ncbi:MAG: hypothetical protein K8T25_03055 [Planctomycetia bacterium]|nr:hypothetical protein [Planctomycetia bacterium]
MGRFLQEDPIGLAGGDANFYRYCGNGPTDATDPDGLAERTINGYKVRTDINGHHLNPVANWAETNFDPSVYSLFDSARARVFQPDGAGHGQFAHGVKTGYNAQVKALQRAELAAFIKNFGENGQLTLKQQRVFTEYFLDTVSGMPNDTFIGGFNEAVQTGGKTAVKNWYQTVGKNFARPELGEPVGISGTAPDIPLSGKVGKVAGSAGGVALAAVNVVGTIETVRDGFHVARGDNILWVPYYWEDEGGTYRYDVSWYSGCIYMGTQKVYVQGPNAGQRTPASGIGAYFKALWKSIFDMPEITPRNRYGIDEA